MVDKLLERVEGWRALAKDNKDPFIRFISEYIAFNALLRRKYGYRTGDGNLIRKIGKEIPEGTFSEKWVKSLKELAPIKNVRYQDVLQPKEFDKKENVIKAVYWIRNNLFHGDKSYSSYDDVISRDEKLVSVGYRILVDVNNWLIEVIKEENA